MATTTTAPTPAPTAAQIETPGPARPAKAKFHDPYFWHKLHSLTGILPIGIFLIQHLIANSYALHGDTLVQRVDSYNTVIKVFGYLPFVAVLEILIIYVPILFHSFYGLFITAYGKYNVGAYSYGRNWQYTLQRVSGVLALIYIGVHVYNTSIQKYVLEWHHQVNPTYAISYQAMAAQNANNWYFLFAAVGIVATVFHFSSGLWNFCIRWGLTISRRSQIAMGYIAAGVFLIFSTIGLWTLTSFHYAGKDAAALPPLTTNHP